MRRLFAWTAAAAFLTACATEGSAPKGAGAVAGGDAAVGGADAAVGGADAAVAAADAAVAADVAASATGPTWFKDVAPLLSSRCVGCHSAKGVGPFPLETYAEAKAASKLLLGAVKAQRMPPWGAQETAECKPRFAFKHDLRLSPADIKTLVDWQLAGAPEGNVADKVDVPKVSFTLANVDVEAKPSAAFVASGDKDQFRCFVLDAEFPEQKFLNGLQFIAGNPQVVHHILLFSAPAKAAIAKAGSAGSWSCFGGVGLPDADFVGGWAPGSVPMEYPADAGAPLAKDSRLVMQVHYHPAGTTAAPDLTRAQLRFTVGKPKQWGLAALIGNFNQGKDGEGLLPGPNDPPGKVEFRIPAGAKGHTETMQFTMPAQFDGNPTPELSVFGVGTHMHYVGTGMRIEVLRTPKAACTQTQVTPIQACAKEKCSEAEGLEALVCASEKCKAELVPLAGACGDCLKAGVEAGQTDQVLFNGCLTAKAPDPSQPAHECLVETPKWDFNWQRLYVFDTKVANLPKVRPGDQLRFTCTYDNSLDNAFVADVLAEMGLKAPVDVLLGEETLDEMCLGLLQVLYPAPK